MGSTQCGNFRILREINFGESRSSETAVFTNLEAVDFVKFQPSAFAKIHKKSKFRASKCVKMADFAPLHRIRKFDFT